MLRLARLLLFLTLALPTVAPAAPPSVSCELLLRKLEQNLTNEKADLIQLIGSLTVVRLPPTAYPRQVRSLGVTAARQLQALHSFLEFALATRQKVLRRLASQDVLSPIGIEILDLKLRLLKLSIKLGVPMTPVEDSILERALTDFGGELVPEFERSLREVLSEETGGRIMEFETFNGPIPLEFAARGTWLAETSMAGPMKADALLFKLAYLKQTVTDFELLYKALAAEALGGNQTAWERLIRGLPSRDRNLSNNEFMAELICLIMPLLRSCGGNGDVSSDLIFNRASIRSR